MTERPEACVGCPANSWGVGFVPPSGDPTKARFAVIGQGPGEQEADYSKPFFPGAPSGRKLTSWLNKCGIMRTDSIVWITNVVWCWLPKLAPDQRRGLAPRQWGNRYPTMEESANCWKRHLRSSLANLNDGARALVIGKPAAEFILGQGGNRHVGTLQAMSMEDIDERANGILGTG